MSNTPTIRSIPMTLGALIAAVAFALLVASPVGAATLTTALTGAAEVPGPGDPDGSGAGLVDVDTTSGEICTFVSWQNIGDPVAGHIHEAPDGAAGPVVLTLFMSTNTQGFVDVCATDAALAADLEANPADYYINIHTAEFPDGAIRGQLGVQAATAASSYINPDTGLPTFNENVDPGSSCETPDQSDTQTVSTGTENNVHNDACLTDALGFAVDTQASFESSGVGVISACPDPDMGGPKTATLSGDGLRCTLSGYQESGGAMGGDFEYHARANSTVAGTQTVTFCADPEGDGCGNATVSDTITIQRIAAGEIMVMKHYCNSPATASLGDNNPQNEADFEAIEARGGGNPIAALVNTVLACPTTALPGDAQTPGAIAHGEEVFDFSVTDVTGASFTLADATFMQIGVCESDVNLDADGDGTIEDDVCLDISHYAVTGVAEGDVTVVETVPPGDHRFGTLRLTPVELDGNDDASTGASFSTSTATITLDTSGDEDAMVMLHVYNFDVAAAPGPGGSPAPTPPTGQLPDTASTGDAGLWPLALFAAGIAIGSGWLVASRRGRRSGPIG